MKDIRKSKNAAPWGTPNWIATYPYSRMDRKRRKRAERAAGAEAVDDIFGGPSVCESIEEIARLCERYGVTLAKSAESRMRKSLAVLADVEAAVRDAAFGSALAKAWGLSK